MPFNGKKSYPCDVGTCGQTFCTADKLNSHRKAHKLPYLVFSNHSPPLQGPQPDDTPARFTKLMDAAGLPQDLSNPFDESFRQAGQNPQPIELIDPDPSLPPPPNVAPPTTADILQQVVEQDDQPWKNETSGATTNNTNHSSSTTNGSTTSTGIVIGAIDQRAPVITTRSSGLITELTENGSRPSSVVSSTATTIGCLEGVTVKTSSSPPPAHPSSVHSSGGPVGSSLLNQLNHLNQHVIVPPMLGMLQQAHSNSGTPLADLSRHFSQIAHVMNHQQSLQHSSHDSASSNTTTARGSQSMMVMHGTDLQIPNSSQHSSNRVGMKRKSGGGSSDDEEERKRKFRENNKRAAQRCRQRKKQEIEETRRERDRLREENQKLTAKLELCLDNEEKLRGQLEKLKMELLEHAHCSVSLKKRNAGVIQYPM